MENVEKNVYNFLQMKNVGGLYVSKKTYGMVRIIVYDRWTFYGH